MSDVSELNRLRCSAATATTRKKATASAVARPKCVDIVLDALRETVKDPRNVAENYTDDTCSVVLNRDWLDKRVFVPSMLLWGSAPWVRCSDPDIMTDAVLRDALKPRGIAVVQKNDDDSYWSTLLTWKMSA